MWIIVKEDIAKIPKGSIPSTWAEGKNAGLDEAREIVKKADKNWDNIGKKDKCIIFWILNYRTYFIKEYLKL